MNNISFLNEFLLVGIIFILFIFIISIFGYFFLFIIRKKSDHDILKKPNLILERFLISFGIGISIHISYGYILNLFNLFNFFTAYLFILFFDIFFLIYYLLIEYKRHFFSNSFKIRFRNFFLNKRKIIPMMAVLIILILSFLLYWNIMTESVGLIWRDPYSWYKKIFYLLDNGSISNVGLGIGYPSGYVFITSGFLLIWPDHLTVYFFVKIASIYFLFLYIIISFLILKHIFKKNYLIYISLLLIYLSNFFLERNIMNLPSSFATILVLISILLVVKGYPLYMQGFFLTALFLIHRLTFGFYFIVIVAYILFKIFLNLRNRKLVFKELSSIFFMLIINIILLIPYILNYPEDISDIFNWYEGIINDPRFQYNYNVTDMEFDHNFLLILPFPLPDILKLVLKGRLINRMRNISKFTIGFFFIFTIYGLFFSFFRKRKKLIIFNLSVILILICNLLPFFLSNFDFIDRFKYRTFETFALSIIILAVFFFECVIKILKRIIHYLLFKFNYFKLKINKNKRSLKFLKIKSVFLLFLLTFITCILIRERELPGYKYLYDDDFVEITLYLRENAEPKSTIGLPFYDTLGMNKLLYNMDCYDYNLSSTITIHEFFGGLRENNIEYLIFNNSKFPETWKDDIYYETYYNRYFGELLLNLTKFSLYNLIY